MARVLVVYHDTNVADIETDELRRAGYEVDRCAGPIGGDPCPIVHGMPCWQVEKADVLVYDVWDAGEGAHDLVADLGRVHPDKPVVLTSAGSVLDEAGTPPVFHAPTRASLTDTVERALRAATSRAAETTPQPKREHEPLIVHGPRW
jgi:DNA-binding NtrC family response regulator